MISGLTRQRQFSYEVREVLSHRVCNRINPALNSDVMPVSVCPSVCLFWVGGNAAVRPRPRPPATLVSAPCVSRQSVSRRLLVFICRMYLSVRASERERAREREVSYIITFKRSYWGLVTLKHMLRK